VDTLDPREIERVLAFMLPGWKVQCRCHPNGTASLDIEGPNKELFAVTGLVRSQYHGLKGIQNLASLLLEELAIVRTAAERQTRA
jgi:hypothetical protein